MNKFWQGWGQAFKNTWSDGYQFGDIIKSLSDVYEYGPSWILAKLGLGNWATNPDVRDAIGNTSTVVDRLTNQSNDTSKELIDYQAAINQNSAERAMQFEAEQAQLERDYQTQSRLNYYPDMVQSMQEAGLNPALLVSQGFGASGMTGSTARGSTAQASAPDGTTNMNTISSMATTAFSIALLWKVFKQLRIIKY